MCMRKFNRLILPRYIVVLGFIFEVHYFIATSTIDVVGLLRES
jgi:hypothetical protein